MKKLIFIVPLLALGMIIYSCSDNEIDTIHENMAEDYEMNSIPFSFDIQNLLTHTNEFLSLKNGEFSKSNNSMTIVTDDYMTVVDGSSTIHRNSSGVTINFTASNAPNIDPAGHAVTLWVVFINPESYPNFYSAYRVGGHVVGKNGKLNFSGRINEGSTKDLLMGEPLQDAENDVAIVITKSHGMANPQWMPAQILTYGGGCDGDIDDGGPLGPCYEFLFAVHHIAWESELEILKASVASYSDLEVAMAAGYDLEVTGYVPHMGYHYLNVNLLDDTFELDKPEILQFDMSGTFVGVEYAVPIADLNSPPPAPEGFTGDFDDWHINSEFSLWTLHVWIGLDNPDGVFAASNPDLE